MWFQVSWCDLEIPVFYFFSLAVNWSWTNAEGLGNSVSRLSPFLLVVLRFTFLSLLRCKAPGVLSLCDLPPPHLLIFCLSSLWHHRIVDIPGGEMRIYFKHDLTVTLVILISSWPQLLYTLKRQTQLLGGERFRSLLCIYFQNIMDRRHLFLKQFVFFYIYYKKNL